MIANNKVQEVNIREYKPREIIVSEGDPSDRFFVILKGDVEIFQNKKSIRVLKEGDVFGIENFYLKRPYTTSAFALSSARVASYNSAMIREFIYHRPQLTERILSSVMNQLEQTTQVAEENIALENVVDLNEQVFQDGEIIIEEGTTGTEIFQLIESEKGLLVSKEGKEVGRISRPGEYFGEMSAILKQKRSATVQSIGRSVIHIFPGDDLDAILESYPKLSKNLIDTLANRILEGNKIITQLGHAPPT